MTSPRLLVSYFITCFSNNASFNDATFVLSYMDKIKNSPLPDPTVSVGVKSFSDKRVNPVYDGNDTLLYNRIVETRISFNIYVPTKSNGLIALDIFNRISNYLMEQEENYDVKGVGCGEIVYMRDESALLLETWVDIERLIIEETTA